MTAPSIRRRTLWPRLEALESRLAPATFTVTNANTFGAGSLSQAVLDANANPGADLIDFSSYFNTPRTITLMNSEIGISGPVTIDGTSAANVTISGNNAVRIITTQAAPAGTSINLVDLTLKSERFAGQQSAGAILIGDEAVSATRCVFTENSAVSGNGGAIAVQSGGSFTATESVFSDNTALSGSGGAIAAVSGATVTLTRCDISANRASGGVGGGALMISGTLHLESSTVSGNQALGMNGGYGYYPSYGGGILVNGTATIRNSTISGNSAGRGGGIDANTLSVQNSTITSNAANYVGGGGIWGTGITLESCIVAANYAPMGPDIFANTVNARTSSIFNRTGIATFNDQGGNRPAGEDPRLGPLQNNGGLSKTHALLPGSPCVDVGSNPATLTTDQRGPGFPRVLNGTTDMGAYEGVYPIPTATPISLPATITSAGGTSYTVVVRYDDDIGIALATIDLNDIAVTGPGYSAPQTPIARSISGSGQVVTVTYTLPAPGGTFDYSDDGEYSVAMVGNQVADTDFPVQHFVAAGPLGTFRVNVPIPGPLVVDQPTDLDDGNLSAGHLSLREAIRLTNAATPASDTITFSSAVFGTPRTIALTAGEFAITDSLTIVGPGANLLTLNAGGASRHFNIALPDPAPLVSLSGLTLINGAVNGSGGAVFAYARLAISDVVISNCLANNSIGGGIAAHYGLTLFGVTISNSTATYSGGGVYANGTVVIVRSSFANNVAGINGGGLYIAAGGLTMQITDSAIVGNSVNTDQSGYSDGGGGIHISSVNTAGSFIRNSTISGNSAAVGGDGGGIFLYIDGALSIANSTITGNTASLGHGGGIAGGWEYANPSLVLNSTIIAGNSASTGPDLSFYTSPNILGNNNLVGVANSGGFTLTGSGNLTGTLAVPLIPQLGPLSNNGGPTKTHALLPGSPTLNAGNNASGLTTDQRGGGFVRVFGSAADIGAFEVQQSPPRIQAVTINDGAAQRSMVTKLVVTFSAQVAFSGPVADAFALRRNGGKPVSFTATSSILNGVTVVTLANFTGVETQFGSLMDGRFTLTALASKISANGQPLDGNGDGFGGDNHAFGDAQGLFRFYGDVNGDRRVDGPDFSAFSSTYGLTSMQAGFLWYFDINGDDVIDGVEFSQFSGRVFTVLP